MRVAFVQGGPGLEAVEAQVARLRRLSPDRYQIEENPTGSARQRMIELFDSLRPGDELCLAALAPLRLDVGETARLLLEIVDRGARLRVAEADGVRLDIGKSGPARTVLVALAALHMRRRDLPAAPPSTAPLELLSADQIADIRRLGQAGMSPRRIGLIYRRSPKCIADLLWGSDGSSPAMAGARRHA